MQILRSENWILACVCTWLCIWPAIIATSLNSSGCNLFVFVSLVLGTCLAQKCGSLKRMNDFSEMLCTRDERETVDKKGWPASRLLPNSCQHLTEVSLWTVELDCQAWAKQALFRKSTHRDHSGWQHIARSERWVAITGACKVHISAYKVTE